MGKFKCILLDLDGTLFDTSEGIMSCYKMGLEHFGIFVNDDSELRKVMGPSLYISYRDFYGLDEEQVKEAVRIYREHYNGGGIYKCRLYDGMENTLKSLKANGFTVCVATSKPQVMAEKILNHFGLAEYFDTICGAELDGSRSDKIELIDTALKRVGFTDKNDVVMAGDRFYDIKGAIGAGVHSIGVTYGFGTKQELVEAGAEYIADTPEDILKIVM